MCPVTAALPLTGYFRGYFIWFVFTTPALRITSPAPEGEEGSPTLRPAHPLPRRTRESWFAKQTEVGVDYAIAQLYGRGERDGGVAANLTADVPALATRGGEFHLPLPFGITPAILLAARSVAMLAGNARNIERRLALGRG